MKQIMLKNDLLGEANKTFINNFKADLKAFQEHFKKALNLIF